MKKRENSQDNKNIGINRRDFIKQAGAAGIALGMTGIIPSFARKAEAAKRDFILIGRPNPSTGPLAGFGEATPWAEDLAVKAINQKGGIYIKELNKKVPVKLKVVDTESNPTKGADVASKLIMQDEVDLMVVLHTPDTVNPVLGICEAQGMPCISLDAPTEAVLIGGPYKWCYHTFWTIDTLTDIEIGMWDQFPGKTNKVVGGLWPNDPDGSTWAKLYAKKLPERGYKIVDPGRFPYFMKDWTSVIDLFKKENVEIISGVLIPPDWATCWRQMHSRGFIPKIATIEKPLLFPADVNALGGNLPNGLTTTLWWGINHPFKSSITGESPRYLCESYTKKTGKQWNMAIGFKYAGIEIAFDALTRAQTLDREAIRDAIAKTNLNTIVGHIKYNEQHYAPTPLVGAQWVKGKKWPWEIEVVYNKSAPEIPKTAEMALLSK